MQCGGYGGDAFKSVPGDKYDFNECPEGMLAVGLWGKSKGRWQLASLPYSACPGPSRLCERARDHLPTVAVWVHRWMAISVAGDWLWRLVASDDPRLVVT